MSAWAFKGVIWEPLRGATVIQPMLKHKKRFPPMLRCWVVKDGWSCGYRSLPLFKEVVVHRGTLEDVDVTLLLKGSSKKQCTS